MPDNPKALLEVTSRFCRDVAVWRVTVALHRFLTHGSETRVTWEAPKTLSPWEDVVERHGETATHRWQAKSGAIADDEFRALLKRLPDETTTKVTLVVVGGARLSGVRAGFTALQRLLLPLSEGNHIDPHDHSEWVDYLAEACGSTAAVEALARRLDVLVFDDLDAPVARAEAQLSDVFGTNSARAALDTLTNHVARSVGFAVSPASLLSGTLRSFGLSPSLPARRRGLREAYLDALTASLGQRRILRDIRQDAVQLDQVWTPLRMSDPGGEDLDADDLVRCIRPGELNVLAGPVGSGKTEVLARTAAAVARHATQDARAPLPLIVRAKDLTALNDDAIATAVDGFAYGTSHNIRELLTVSTERWILLVDGVEERAHGVEVLGALSRRFPGATVLAACRPNIALALAPAPLFRLEPWSLSDGERFLQRLAVMRPEHANALGSLGLSASRLLVRPLTASLAAIVVVDGGTVPENETLLFQAAIPKLVETWAESRSIKTRWRDVATDIQRMALAHVRGQRDRLSTTELAELARRIAPDRSEALKDAAELDFGLLVPVDGGYEFLLRGLAEYLAGAALCEEATSASLAPAARSLWGSEAARHALILGAAQAPSRFLALLADLLPEAATGTLEELRAILVAVRVVADTGVPDDELAQRFASIALALVTDESSPWRADYVAAALEELAQHGGPVWALIQEPSIALLDDRREPSDYFRGLPDRDAQTWLRLLFHCDPETRSEAVRRLEPFVDEPEVTNALLLMLRDSPGYPSWTVPPAIEAGRVLRAADRSLVVGQYLDILRALSAQHDQIACAAAALALRPTEHNLPDIVSAMRRGASAHYIPREAVDTLASTEAGLRALDEFWPDWRQYSRPDRPMRRTDTTAPIPPSRHVRRRLMTLVRHASVREEAVSSRLRFANNENARDIYLEACCEAGLHRPQELLGALLAVPHEHFPLLTTVALDALGRCALRHPAVRDRLVGSWSEFRPGPNCMSYPGRALEPLIVSDDEAAIRVYAEWFRRSPYAAGIFAVRAMPDQRVFDRSAIRAEAEETLRRVWELATRGRLDDKGERMLLSPISAANLLRMLPPALNTAVDVVRTLFAWLGDRDPNCRRAALSGFECVALSDEEKRELLEPLRAVLASGGALDQAFTVPAALRLAVSQGIAHLLEPEMRRIVAVGGLSAVAAACTLMHIVPAEEAAGLSAAAAGTSVGGGELHAVDDDELRSLVALAPQQWAEAVLQHGVRGPLFIGLAWPVFGALPLTEKRAVARALHDSNVVPSLPWRSDRVDQDMYRPADLVERMLFDCGEM